MLIERYNEVKKHVEEACKRVGRDPREVTVIAVSKTKPLEMVEELRKEKVLDFGENKVQEIMEKYEPMGPGVHWHLIGHLQTNKVKYIIDKVDMIHSVESLRLAEEINKRAAAKDLVMDILVEVNMADEESKFGVKPEEVEAFLHDLSQFPNIRVRGLMTVAPFVENPEENRVYFRKMRELLVDMNGKKIDNINMDMLSMGMTGDYEVAIEEGATIVRVGTGIFGERFYPNKA